MRSGNFSFSPHGARSEPIGCRSALWVTDKPGFIARAKQTLLGVFVFTLGFFVFAWVLALLVALTLLPFALLSLVAKMLIA